MSPIYEDENTTREALFELRKKNRCQECHGRLDVLMDFDRGKAFLACAEWNRSHHEGIEREAEPLFEPNIPTRREDMIGEMGEEKAMKLERYEGVVTLSREQAMYVLRTIWPEAPDVEVIKAAIICHQYGLNPLRKHLALIPFKKRNRRGEVIGEEWVTVMEISSNRLMARRKHNYSYLDMTPRRMTEEEQQRINGEVDDTKIWALTILKDVKTGAEANGVGSWPAHEEPYGVEKGNTKLNMAKIRSERQALDRLYPAEMPQGVEVMEEKYIEGDYTLLAVGAGVKTMPREGVGESRTGVGVTPAQKAENKPTTSGAPPAEPKVKAAPVIEEPTDDPFPPDEVPPEPTEEPETTESLIDLEWLKEQLNILQGKGLKAWSNTNILSYLNSITRGQAKTVSSAVALLTHDQAQDFVNKIRDTLEMI